MKYRRAFKILLASSALACSAALAGSHEQEAGDANSSDQSAEMKQMAKDAWLDGKLEGALLFNSELNSFHIDTKVKSGTAYLNGAVESEIDKELAGEVAKSVDGIDKVENQLTIDTQAVAKAEESESWQQQSAWRQTVSNATLTATVKSKLLLNEHTDGLDINVDSMNGVVTLSGTVGSDAESALAEQIASNAEGSRDVNNRLNVATDKS